MPGEELIEQDPQRIDVRRGGQALAEDLLGAGVIEAQGTPSRHRQAVLAVATGVEDLGNAKVEQLGGAGRVDQDVARFEVAVNHQMLVRRLDPRADFQKELEAAAYVQAPGVAPLVDGLALDVLHHEVGASLVARAAVVEPRDARVVELGEDLALGEETAHNLLGVHATFDQLEGHPTLELAVAAGQVDRAMPPRPRRVTVW